MIRTALLLLSGNAFSSLLLLIRNLVIARLVTTEDYGIASTFAISMAIVEIISNIGLQQMIVQDREGNDPRLQASMQGFQVLRGALSSILLFLIAGPLARFLGVPEVVWAYQILAIQPFMMACYHFDMHRFRRQMRYIPSLLVEVLPAFLSLILVWPLFWLFNDYRVMLYALLIQAFAGLVTSHLVAERPFVLDLERDIVARSIRFGWPLLLNGGLLFIVLNGEKLVVGNALGMVDLAIFSMGFTLTLTPTLVVARSAQAFFLPQLSASQNDDAEFTRVAYAGLEFAMLNGASLLFAVVLIGEQLVDFLLGEKFAALIPLMVWFGILHAVRVLKSLPATIGLARAKTENAMIGNLFRVISVPLSYWAAIETGDLRLVLFIAIGGELLGYVAALALLRIRVGMQLSGIYLPLAALSVFILAAGIWGLTDHAYLRIATCVLFFVFLLSLRNSWRYAKARRMVRFDA